MNALILAAVLGFTGYGNANVQRVLVQEYYVAPQQPLILKARLRREPVRNTLRAVLPPYGKAQRVKRVQAGCY